MKLKLFLPVLMLVMMGCDREESLREMSDRVFERAIAQSVLMDSQLGDDEFPRSFTADSLVTSNCEWWCSGFFPGTLWYIYEYTGNEQILSLVKKQTAKVYGLYNKKTDHDIGFQIKILSFLVIGLANVVSLAGNMIKRGLHIPLRDTLQGKEASFPHRHKCPR